jgi:hypothetical protein
VLCLCVLFLLQDFAYVCVCVSARGGRGALPCARVRRYFAHTLSDMRVPVEVNESSPNAGTYTSGSARSSCLGTPPTWRAYHIIPHVLVVVSSHSHLKVCCNFFLVFNQRFTFA